LRDERVTFRYDFVLFATVILLALVGLVTLYSASYMFALNQPWRFGGGMSPLRSNVIACIMMLVLFPALAFANLDALKRGWVVGGLVALTLLLNVLPLVPFFQRSDFVEGVDVSRWIIFSLGGAVFSFQPSEMIKIVLPLYLAYILDKNGERLDRFFYGPFPPALVTGAFCVLVLAQNNFSEVVLIAFIALAVCFVAGLRLRWFAVAAAIAVPIGYWLIQSNPGGRWYQRLQAFLNPEMSGLDSFQIDMSLEAIRSGGFFGRGIGQGVVNARIPEVHGDFVFASFAEEFGLLGVFLHLALIGIFAGIVFYVVWRGKDRFSQILAFGLVAPIVMQTLLNVAVVGNVVPTTGLALPFVSSGGSSMLMTLCASALLVNLVRRHALSRNKEDPHVG